MKKSLLLLLLVLAFPIFSAQTITFISQKTNKPLPKVSVFGKDGSILAYSDIDGKIDKNLIKPDQEKFQLVYDNFSVATLNYIDFEKEIIKVDDRIRNIEPVIIKNNKPAKYVFVKGNFNAYVTVNNKLNCYADGIVIYMFDNKTKKLKATTVEQYRIYRLEDAVFEKKQTGMWDYQALLRLPEMKEVGNILEFKRKNSVIKELKSSQKDQIEITGEALQEKEFAFFGYRFYDIRNIINAAYEKDSPKTLRDLLEFNEIGFLKLKHKSEPEYNQLIVYKNFYPTELDFQDKNLTEKNKFDLKNSSYTTKYWEDQDFPNMQSVFSSYFGDKLKEKQNIK
ncbi:hypothetical protein [Chryseobacterium profundimaris]|uniref:YARHG domain-containing protein n=1 Tax=Chryseobacterium profundimaris TaxID=1387275 RepID=A0ABY1NB62_9FLAO|nr:hypothetical protein [Chryseobacterium profundimaris]SMP03398.1 hypothetical protein SAMN06264346_101185 [Chryseobacterium profundimaris]